MKARFQVLERVVGLLTLASTLGLVLRAARDPFHVDVLQVLSFVVVFAYAWREIRRGRSRRAAWITAVVGSGSALLLVALRGGVASEVAPYLPLGGAMLWMWVGRREALVFVAASVLVLVAHGVPPASALAAGYDAQMNQFWVCVFAAAIVMLAVTDLRAAVRAAWDDAKRQEAAAKRAQAADDARQGFLALVSRQLRDPLDVVLGYAGMLLEDETDPERVQDLQRISRAGGQLLALVQDLLDMSNLDKGVPVEQTEVDVVEVAVEVVDIVRLMADPKRVELRLELADRMPRALADARRLRQIVTNLTVNALKYTERGAVTLRLGAEGSEVWLQVHDTGVGIPPERMSDLFTPFVQLHQGTERRPGVGLGLALSQQLAIRMGGRITVESTLGRGSTFTVWLPACTPTG